jgi:hypothetical protein
MVGLILDSPPMVNLAFSSKNQRKNKEAFAQWNIVKSSHKIQVEGE